jgi:hypothetical protein
MKRAKLERLQAEMRGILATGLGDRQAEMRTRLANKPAKEPDEDGLNKRMWRYLKKQRIAVGDLQLSRCVSPQSCLATPMNEQYLTYTECAEIGRKAVAYLRSRGQRTGIRDLWNFRSRRVVSKQAKS